MFCKILNKQRVVDVLDTPVYICYINESIPITCSRKKASAVYSSDQSRIWHIEGWGKHPSFADQLCRLVEITSEEYASLKEAIAKGFEEPQPENPLDIVINDELITLETIREYKINKMREFCSQAIVKGVDVALTRGVEHFDLEVVDQINLNALQDLVNAGASKVPYHSTNNECKLYSADEVRLILNRVTEHRIWHTTYFNALKSYILKLNSISAISDLYYGSEIPEEYQTEALKYLLNK